MAKPATTPRKRPTPTTKRRGKKASANTINPIKPNTKTALLFEMLSKPAGATLDNLVKKIGWQTHSVRGAIYTRKSTEEGLDQA